MNIIKLKDISKPTNTKDKLVFINENSQLKDPNGKIKSIVLHWTAGRYNQVFNGYHYNIALLDKKPYIVQTLELNQKPQALWGRNGETIQIAISSMYSTSFKPTNEQIETTAYLIAELCFVLNLDIKSNIPLPKKKIINGQIKTISGNINAPIVSDHAFYAKQDGYYPDRWDIGEYMEIIRKKAIWYYSKLVSKEKLPVLLEII